MVDSANPFSEFPTGTKFFEVERQSAVQLRNIGCEDDINENADEERRSRSAVAQLLSRERLIRFLAVDKFLQSPNTPLQRTPQTKWHQSQTVIDKPQLSQSIHRQKQFPSQSRDYLPVASGRKRRCSGKVKSATTASVAGQYKP